MRLQSRLRYLRQLLPGLPPGVFYLKSILRYLSDQLGVQLSHQELLMPVGFLDQPVGHLRQEMRNKRGLQYHHPGLRLSSGTGQGQRGMPDLSLWIHAYPRRQRLLHLQRQLALS